MIGVWDSTIDIAVVTPVKVVRGCVWVQTGTFHARLAFYEDVVRV
jgi:hypothetical protein